jgi:hypothetical protein
VDEAGSVCGCRDGECARSPRGDGVEVVAALDVGSVHDGARPEPIDQPSDRGVIVEIERDRLGVAAVVGRVAMVGGGHAAALLPGSPDRRAAE